MTFLVKSAIPTDAVSMLYAGQLTEEESAEAAAIIRAKFHLDKPPLVQFYYYVADIMHGDLGVSVRTRALVADEIPIIVLLIITIITITLMTTNFILFLFIINSPLILFMKSKHLPDHHI